MPFIWILALFMPLCAAVALLSNRRLTQAAPMVFLSVALGLNILGMLSLLHIGIWIFYAAIVAAAVYVLHNLWQCIRHRRLPVWLTIDTVLLICGIAVLWWACRGHRYANWDEFTHWGRAVKVAFEQNVLPSLGQMRSDFKEYPPGLAPLQALVLQAARMPFREDVVIFTQGVFSLSLLYYPLHRFNKKSTAAASLTAVVMLLAPLTVYWYYFAETTVDGLLGVLFGFVVLVQLLGPCGRFERILQTLACAMLPLTKASGMLLAVLACVVIVVSEFAAGSFAKKQNKTENAQTNTHKTIKQKLAVFLPLGSALAAYGAWNAIIAIYQIPRRWQPQGFSLEDILALITGSAPAWKLETIRLYFANIFADFNYGWPGGFFPFMAFFAIFAVLFFVLYRMVADPQHKKRFKIVFLGMFAAGILYTGLVLCNYLFFFSEYEAVRLASLSRYLNTYLVGMFVMLFGWLAVALQGKSLRVQCGGGLAAIALWVFMSNPEVILPQFVNASAYAVQTTAVQNQYTQAANDIRAVSTAEVPPVYVIAQNDIGATAPRLDYELAPQSYLAPQTTSIGVDVSPDDILSQRLSVQEWAQLLLDDGFEYVYLFAVDNTFAADYGELFPGDEWIVNGNMFSVVPTQDGVGVELQPIENSI